MGIPNTANVYFSQQISPALVGTIVGFYWFSMLIGRLVGATMVVFGIVFLIGSVGMKRRA